jgi:hypothetical protein
MALIALIFGVACAAGAVMWLLRPMDGTHPADAPVRDTALRPALQDAPQLDLARYRLEKQRELDITGPVQGEPGYTRIPLAQAIDLIARRGLHPPPAGADNGAKGTP